MPKDKNFRSKIPLIAQENLTEVMEYFDGHSKYNQLKIAILGKL